MKFYQCKHKQRVYKPLLILHTFVYGILGFSAIRSKAIFAAVILLLMALGGLIGYVYSRLYKKSERKIEIGEDGINYHAMDRDVTIKWCDIANISLHFFCHSPINRVVFFNARGVSPSYRKARVTDKRMWSEYDDEMLEEIKKYWHGRIWNYDRYIKYKKKKMQD